MLAYSKICMVEVSNPKKRVIFTVEGKKSQRGIKSIIISSRHGVSIIINKQLNSHNALKVFFLTFINLDSLQLNQEFGLCTSTNSHFIKPCRSPVHL